MGKKISGGPQLQNIPLDIREVFIPDSPDHEFTSADLKQAEAMVVAWDSEDLFLINAFQSGKDIHRIRACIAFRDWRAYELPPDDLLASIEKVCPDCKKEDKTECVHSERYISKRLGHATAYKMGARKMVKVLRAEGIFISEARAKYIQSKLISPSLLQWQDRIANELKKGWLDSPVGRKREFRGLYDEEMVRAALSWRAQHIVSHVTNAAMIKLFNMWQQPNSPRIVTQTHDSVLISHLKELRQTVYSNLKSAFYHPLQFHGRELVIPIDIGSGLNWATAKG